MTPPRHKDTPSTRIYILQQAAPLFAKQGCNGVSMRDLSKAVDLSAAAIYHHFSDKKTLYLEVMKYVFLEKTSLIEKSIGSDGTALERLEMFVERFAQLLGGDSDYRALVLWALLDDDKSRVKLVAEDVFSPPFKSVKALVEEIDPEADHYMLTTSIVLLIVSHFATIPMSEYLPGWRSEYGQPEIVSKHVMEFLTQNTKLKANSEVE